MQLQQMLAQSDLICSEAEIQAALHRLSNAIHLELAEAQPLVLIVMNGAIIFAGQLLPMLKFSLEVGYVDVSRYGNAEQGGVPQWRNALSHSVTGRTVLVLDELLDRGETLRAIREHLIAQGAKCVYSAVLAEKRHKDTKAIEADFIGLSLPDRFVFGYGMDQQGAWRNLPAIYALRGK